MIADVCVLQMEFIKGRQYQLTFTYILLSLQFLDEKYTLVDVLYYVTRDDLKYLRLRYHFCFCVIGTMERALG